MRWLDLLTRAQALADGGGRRILGIAGGPGAGKSTVARRLVDALGGAAVLVGMDGYHLTQSELQRLGRAGRKEDNARLIAPTAVRADLILDPTQFY